jgi:hypothetical protein
LADFPSAEPTYFAPNVRPLMSFKRPSCVSATTGVTRLLDNGTSSTR